MEPIDRIIMLFHRRWAIPVLAEVHRGRGAKFITLAKQLGIGRTTLRATIDDLIDQGLLARHPGTGHPMRPEYVLTPLGEHLAPSSSRLLSTVRRLDLGPIAFHKWTMPVTCAIGSDETRFGELRERLGPITPRALTLTLKDLGHAGLVRRDVWDDYPPTATYRLERRGRTVLAAMRPVVRAMSA